MSTYEEEFPPDRKPPAVKNYDGGKLLKAKNPVYSVSLDAGAMRAVWELLEAEAKYRYPTRATMTGAEALCRAVTAFRKSFWGWPDNEREYRERLDLIANPKPSIAKAVLAKHKASVPVKAKVTAKSPASPPPPPKKATAAQKKTTAPEKKATSPPAPAKERTRIVRRQPSA